LGTFARRHHGPAVAEWLPHGLAAAAQAEGLQVAPHETSLVLNQFGVYLHARAQWTEAREALERPLALGEAAYGPDHPEVAADVNNLGNVLHALGDLAGARAAYERALRIVIAYLGAAHPSTQRVQRNLEALESGRSDAT
jgi:Tfp pilus assembly protein PilF